MQYRSCFFISACVTHSLVERLIQSSLVLLCNKDKNPENQVAQQLLKIYERRLLQPHSQKKDVSRNDKNYQPKKKKLFKVRKINVTARPMLLFIEQVFDSSVISFIFHFYFPWLTIDHKIKCIQAKIFQTQVGWSLDSCTHRWDR